MRAEFFVDYDLYDVTAIPDSTAYSESNSDFADLSKLKTIIPSHNYATLEHNFFVLDGSMEEFPDEPDDIAYFSDDFVKSNDNFYYAGTELYAGDDLDGPIDEIYQNQKITINFTENHTSVGLTLFFMNEYPLEIKIVWYDLAGIFKSQKYFYPTSTKYFCKNQVEDFGKIEIIFTKALPYHNAKLQRVEYGTTMTWGYDKIKSGKLINDASQTSEKIGIDRLTFSFVDSNEEFNVGNPYGLHKTFQRSQRLYPYEKVPDKIITLGTFFLDKVSTTKNVCKMEAFDYKGKLEETDYKNGKVYDGELAGVIIDDIMSVAGIYDYTVDDDVYNKKLYGTIGIMTCRSAMREVLFACGATINTSHISNVEIKAYNRTVKSKIGRDRKFSTTYEIDKYISDVNVKYKTWTLESEKTQIIKSKYKKGENTIQLTVPAINLSISPGEILESRPYYIRFSIPQDAEVTITGNRYNGVEYIANSRIDNIKSGQIRSEKTFTGSLLDYEAAKEAADRLLEYYSLQSIIKDRHIADTEKAGDFVEIENTVAELSDFVVSIVSMETDLTGGFISSITCRGYNKVVTNYYYAGTELYADSYTDIVAGEVI